MKTKILGSLVVLILVISCGKKLPPEVSTAYADLPEKVDYNFHIKPILSDRCYACHGPDEQARKGGFRLDEANMAKSKGESGKRPIVEGSVSQSDLCRRILSTDDAQRMPPPESKLQLNAYEKALLIKWIEQGAEYKAHWSFIAPQKSEVPTQMEAAWLVNNDIDLFVQQTLHQKGLEPSGRATKEQLLKRVYMDLTGLPPSIVAIDQFLKDDHPAALEKVVDQLLQSDACAEHLTLEWLDIARYADSHGMHADGWRNMWPWRDWVINAFRKNMPYDKFVIEQLAGDLLPNATQDQILATAFHRNHPMTAEGGAIDEEFRLEYVADRTNTTATAIMGLTMECARCHDHKFDPISQKEYYQMTAFFNNVREVGMTGDDGNYGPLLQLASAPTQEKINQIQTSLVHVEEEIRQESAQIKALKNYLRAELPYNLKKDLLITCAFDSKSISKNKERDRTTFDHNNKAFSNGNPALVEGIRGSAIEFINEYDEVYVDGLDKLDVEKSISVSLWINTSKKKPGKTQVLIGNAGDKNNFWRGWDFYLEDDNTLSLRLINALPHNLIHLQSIDVIPLNTWTQLAFTYEGNGKAQGARLYINGTQVETIVRYDRLYQNIRPIGAGPQEEVDRPLRISKSYRSFTGDNGIFIGKMDDLRIYSRPVSSLEIAKIYDSTLEINDQLKLNHAIRSNSRIQQLEEKRSDMVKEFVALNDTIAEIMVMEEMPQARPTFVLSRGQYDARLEEVKPATPKQVLPFPDDFPRNRLGLAKWLFDAEHPLTSRAAVNRYWQLVFGQGIVKSARDFGNQGELPSNPELLDWLAVTLQEQDWDIKALLKMMVMSATYQQNSIASDKQKEIDPENIYLGRGSSYRWSAEQIRDNALAASGLLVRTVGGPSVKPYQPEGLWIEKGTFSHKLLRYKQDVGDGLYRRSLYTFIKRTSPHPAMTVFDAPNRDVCTISRESTNTPLQALVMLNDPQYVEAARRLGERMQKEGRANLGDQITLGFRLITGRRPTDAELDVLEKLYHNNLDIFMKDPNQAIDLLRVGDSKYDDSLPVTKNAAMAMVASTLINMDESYTKR